MTEKTYLKHKKILNFLIKEFTKHYNNEYNYIIKRDLTNIISGLQYNFNHLEKFNHKQLYILNKDERDLIDVLNSFYSGLNNKYSKEYILKLYK